MELVEMWIHDTMREYKLCVLMASHVLQDKWSALTESTGIWRRSVAMVFTFPKGIWLVFLCHRLLRTLGE